MAEDSWPASDHVNMANDGEYERLVAFEQSAGNGLPSDTSMVFADSSGMQVKIRANKFALVRGHEWTSGSSDFALAISANGTGSTRQDLVVLRFTRADAKIRAVVKTGSTTLTTDAVGSGVWEIAIGQVAVPAGASTIAAGAVTRKEYFLGPLPIVCTSNTRPPHAPGLKIYETDTGKTYTSTGAAWITGIEDTGWVDQTPASGFTAPYGFRARRYNGVVHVIIGGLQRTAGNIAANIATTVGSLAAGYRPDTNAPVLLFTGSNQVCNANIGPSGALIITNFPALPTNGYLLGGSANYPMGS